MYRGGYYLGYTYMAKVYDEPSRLGIDNGRISKLTVCDYRKTVVNYDRGWDVWPKDIDHYRAYTEIKRRLLE